MAYRITCLVSLLLVGCSDSPPTESSDRKEKQALTSTERNTYTVTGPDTTDSNVARRTRQLAEVVLGRALVDAPFQESLARSVGDVPGSWYGTVDAVEPGLQVRYEYSSDTLVVTNAAFEFQVPANDDGILAKEDDARAVFRQVITRLDEVGLISASDYHLDHVAVGSTDYIASARSDEEPPDPKVLNFRFSVQRVLDGLPFRDSHVRIAVHKSGRIASIKLRRAGVSLVQSAPTPTTVSFANCEARFAREYPSSHVHFSQVAYVLPDPKAHGIAESRHQAGSNRSQSRGCPSASLRRIHSATV